MLTIRGTGGPVLSEWVLAQVMNLQQAALNTDPVCSGARRANTAELAHRARDI
jgi:hypothetical protein